MPDASRPPSSTARQKTESVCPFSTSVRAGVRFSFESSVFLPPERRPDRRRESDRCDAARPGSSSRGEAASVSCRDFAEPSLLGEDACSPREGSLSKSAGTGVSSPLDA